MRRYGSLININSSGTYNIAAFFFPNATMQKKVWGRIGGSIHLEWITEEKGGRNRRLAEIMCPTLKETSFCLSYDVNCVFMLQIILLTQFYLGFKTG